MIGRTINTYSPLAYHVHGTNVRNSFARRRSGDIRRQTGMYLVEPQSKDFLGGFFLNKPPVLENVERNRALAKKRQVLLALRKKNYNRQVIHYKIYYIQLHLHLSDLRTFSKSMLTAAGEQLTVLRMKVQWMALASYRNKSHSRIVADKQTHFFYKSMVLFIYPG